LQYQFICLSSRHPTNSTKDIPPIVPTTEEKKFVCQQGDLIYFLKQAFDVEEGTEASGRLLSEMLKVARDRASDDLQNMDLTEENAVILYHDMSLGFAAKAHLFLLIKSDPMFYDQDAIDRFRFDPDDKDIPLLKNAVYCYQRVRVRGQLCDQELHHRFSQLDEHILAFIALLLPGKEGVNTSSFTGANQAIVDLFQSMIPEVKNNADEMFGLECVSRAVRNMGKETFLSAETHTTEHDFETQSVIDAAIAEERDRQLTEIKQDPQRFLYQLTSLLNGETKWEGKVNPLRYSVRRISNQFSKMAEKQVQKGRHWNKLQEGGNDDDTDEDGRTMVWLDAPSGGEEDTGGTIMDTINDSSLQSQDTPEGRVFDRFNESVDPIIDKIEVAHPRLAKTARIYFESEIKPTQQEIAEKLGVTDRTVRSDLEKLKVFLEKMVKEQK